MPQRRTQSDVLFYLRPYNRQATALITHPDNAHLVSTFPDGTPAVALDLSARGPSSTTLITLGQGDNVDLYVEGSGISRVQCSFEMDLDTGEVMFVDRSSGCTSQVFGETATPFRSNRTRKVVVERGLNEFIGMGGDRCNLIQFRLDWPSGPKETAAMVREYGRRSSPQMISSREAPTLEDQSIPLRCGIRIPAPESQMLKIRYVSLDRLGRGTFGEVFKAVDMDSGKLIAVKVLQKPETKTKQIQWEHFVHTNLKREVENLSAINHPNIVECLGSQGWDEPVVEIFMALKEGTLESLVEEVAEPSKIANMVLRQMLQALDCIASVGIVHRDVKPANILYVSQPEGAFTFQLGDFGACSSVQDAESYIGTRIYMAPEVYNEERQTSKIDVWSLFVTMMWVLDIDSFREAQFYTQREAEVAILSAASKMPFLTEMAVVDSNERASAAQMLVKLFRGEGLSTRRSQVPALQTSSSPSKDLAGRPSRSPAPPPTSYDGAYEDLRYEARFDQLNRQPTETYERGRSAMFTQPYSSRSTETYSRRAPTRANPDAMSYIMTSVP